MSDADLKIDEYSLVNCIATGTHTQVWEVAEDGTPNHWAMKLVLPEALADKENIVTLKYEIKVAKSFDHPNVLRIYKVVANKANAYLIMDLFKSLNLKAFIASDLPGVQSRFRRLAEQLCLAYGHMHEKGWLHKDIKPDNILLNKSSEVRVIDFSLSGRAAGGLAQLMGSGAKIIQGTRTYIAPETIKKQPSTPQTDIYSLGITLFECLTGKRPFTGTSPNDLLRQHLAVVPPPPSEWNKTVTPELDRLIVRMLAKKPKERQKDMKELYTEFQNVKLFKEDAAQETQKVATDAVSAEDNVFLTSGRLDSKTDAKRLEILRTNPELAKTLQEQAAAIRAKSQKKARRRIQPDTRDAKPKPTAAVATPKAAPPPPMMAPPMMMPPMMMPPMMMPPMPMPMMPQPMQPMPMFPPQSMQPMPGLMPPQAPFQAPASVPLWMPLVQQGMPPAGLPPQPMPVPQPVPGQYPPAAQGASPGLQPRPPGFQPAPPATGAPPVSAPPQPPRIQPPSQPAPHIQPHPAAAAPPPQVAPPVPAARPPQQPKPAPPPVQKPKPDDLELMTELPDIL